MSYRLFWFCCLFEAALLGVAVLVAWLLDIGLFREVRLHMVDVAWGVAATGPMLLGFAWTMNSSAEAAVSLRRDMLRMVRLLFRGWSAWQLVVIALLAGVCEEALFRGVLQDGLTDVIGPWPALVAASVTFGLTHPISRAYVLATTAMGLLLGGLFLMAGNLLAPMVAHAAYDLCALLWYRRRCRTRMHRARRS